ncbi:RNA polymerase sigma factor [Agathobacter sp. LCP21S3_B2]|uniref:RNA polymerase sigma factor n=1 Tax=Agathobacter sp. LCP21S3_B2 TaxID=3438734 RepID=UPI003F8F97A6
MLTYEILVNQLTSTITRNKKTGRVLTPQQLQKSGLNIIDQHSDSEVDIIVYEDGSIMYHSHGNGQKEHRMVFDIRKAKMYTNPYKKQDIHDLSPYDAIIAITVYATERLISNDESVSFKYTVPSAHSDEVFKTNGKSEKKEKKKPVKMRCNTPTEPSPDVLDIITMKETMQEEQELKIKLKECIKDLKPAQREIIELYYYKNYNENEISKKLECPRTTIASRRKKALKLLAEKLGN